MVRLRLTCDNYRIYEIIEKEMTMDKKSLIAILLIGVLWGGYFILFKPEQPKKKPEAIKTEAAKKETIEKTGISAEPVKIEPIGAGGYRKAGHGEDEKILVHAVDQGCRHYGL